jgi:hypothetical protein
MFPYSDQSSEVICTDERCDTPVFFARDADWFQLPDHIGTLLQSVTSTFDIWYADIKRTHSNNFLTAACIILPWSYKNKK